MNKDYIRGIKFLLEKSKKQGINIRKVQWIPNVSKILSEHDLCYKFWYNVWNQKKLREVLFCENWYDVLFNSHHLFDWYLTDEGYSFWNGRFHSIVSSKMHPLGLSGWNIEVLRSITLYQ